MIGPIQRSRALVVAEPQEHDAAGRRARRRYRNVVAERGSGLLNRALLGLVVVLFLFVGVGGWSASVELSGAVVAPGRLVVESNVKRIQHAGGGVVGEIRVRNGDVVRAGDLLLTIDDSQVRAASQIHGTKIVQLESERARLVAEREGALTMVFPSALGVENATSRHAFDQEQRLLDARRRGWAIQRSRLGERIVQARREIESIEAQRKAKDKEIELIRQELKLVDDLHKRQLANVVRLIAMKREIARYEGEKGALDGQTARVESSIAELELQIVELDQKISTDVQKQLRDVEGQLAELTERKAAADELVRRTEIRAPSAGIVHELQIHTIGGVVRPGETILSIVPERETLSAEVRISPRDIDQVAVGQRALLRFATLNKEKSPEVVGSVIHVGADVSREAGAGREYFVARIDVPRPSLKSMPELKLGPGMPVDGFIETEKRTALSYLMKPITDHFAKALREN